MFNEHFPYYLAIGMTYKQYWEEDCTLVKHYRKADEIKQKRVNQEAWLQGMYIYDVLLRVSPVLHAFAKSDVKPVEYLKKPYSITEDDRLQDIKEQEIIEQQKAKAFMEAFAAANNKKYEERK